MIRAAITGAALLLTQAAAGGAQGAAPAPRPPTAVGVASLSLGAFNYDAGGDAWTPLVAARLARVLSSVFVAEAGLSHARATVDRIRYYERPGSDIPEVEVSQVATPITTADLSLQAQLPLRLVQPYVGVAAGVFVLAQGRIPAEFREGSGKRHYAGASRAALGGVRVPVTPRLALRAELRLRRDRHAGGFDALDVEQTGGVAWRF